VLNDTRVIPARLYGHKVGTGGRVELLLLEELAPGAWSALCGLSRRPRPGARLELAGGTLVAEVVEWRPAGGVVVRLQADRPLLEVLEAVGVPPLPPYIKRKVVPGGAPPAAAGQDRERYQTVYAREPGAVAAPTAGLHFTRELLAELERAGIGQAMVTLHVGMGTFKPVAVEDVAAHPMEAERYTVPAATAERVNATRAAGGRVVAVGSTAVRTLETVADADGRVAPGTGRTAIYIYPPYRFRAVDGLLTNFHLPRSTLLMMVSALAGHELTMAAYREAIRERYRFYSYGDCMLIL
jgi:S-adenosylmethionine:tRNA ribosyltransferase-isomerase